MAEIRLEEDTKAPMRELPPITDTSAKIRPVLVTNEGNLGLKKNSWDRGSCHHRLPAKPKDG